MACYRKLIGGINLQMIEQKKNARKFIERWESRGSERQDSQSFWLDLLETVYGIENPSEYIKFEDKVHLDNTSYIDGFIDETKVMIEQKGVNKNLNKGIKQSDGSFLTPFQQAKRYSANVPYSRRPRWIVTSNFREFYVYDMEQPNGEPNIIKLIDLEKEYYRLDFLVNIGNEHLEREVKVSMKAGNLVGKIYDELLTQYRDPTNPDSLKSINQLCVRLVFCLYAEDSGIFDRHGLFHDFLGSIETRFIRQTLIELFKVLNTKPENRDPYLDEKLAEFPYVNGGMFADENIEIPNFTDELRELIVSSASENFDWSEISPTIFGAMFESTLNPETRRKGGMHYTSIENIHKVIDPLFLDELKDELNTIKQLKQPKVIRERAEKYQDKLSSLTFFDPACGSGNFLTETYLSLRKLENEAIKLIYGNQSQLALEKQIIKVSIRQFYGIEINDFAVSVGKTALWIAESQMIEETKSIVYTNDDFLPLKTYTNIIEGNALRMNWTDIIAPAQLDFIMGNPPFIGHQWRSDEQKEDMVLAFNDLTKHGKLDYVCGWYNKALDYMRNTSIKAALVSTNSIIQGESVPILWKHVFSKGLEIQFAYQSFKWLNEAKDQAGVTVVIIGFTAQHDSKPKLLFKGETMVRVNHINGYLIGVEDIYIQSRGKPLKKNMPIMSKGSQPTDGGHLVLSEEERDDLLNRFPELVDYVKLYLGSNELIKGKKRYCLWLKNVNPKVLKSNPVILEKLRKISEIRRESPTKSVNEQADYPWLFTQIRQPQNDYLAVPEVSSEKRRYIPISFLSSDIIASNKLYILPTDSMYIFGILSSNVHMSWVRTVAGRLEERYSYSPAVYNNFPWIDLAEEERIKISQTAQAIIDARELYPDSSLADLYDELTMPVELRKAHQANDRAVMRAYGMDIKITAESDSLARLFELYQK